MKVLLIYFLVINVLEFGIAGYDKSMAIKQKRRIPENTLFFLAFIGGSIGLLTAMFLFTHKTSKISFILKFAGIILFQIAIGYLIFTYK
ncbi:DUF1294 domain-containing protein [Flavobacterium reichenbachii]|uniref:Membrane protein n=1 Tax=Flavobacterium reichenbachii TaxID=362418 RepID=A0A085ZSL3_9FLAO|nr:DUF1294 domain-containing protein [Flavobacterium reichenbachii]KFF07427.1 membrane protein [Flavobacterium reichenbachii]OXB13092.1 hypothetical protein B0A68_15065 [Flavobacterium reichenbachii]